jgi:hypothetical protein
MMLMDSTNLAPGEPPPMPRQESTAARRQRLDREADLLAQAQASAAAGRTVSDAQVDAWIDSMASDNPLPTPRSSP